MAPLSEYFRVWLSTLYNSGGGKFVVSLRNMAQLSHSLHGFHVSHGADTPSNVSAGRKVISIVPAGHTNGVPMYSVTVPPAQGDLWAHGSALRRCGDGSSPHSLENWPASLRFTSSEHA